MKCESLFFKTFLHALMFNTSYPISLLERSCLLYSREVILPQLAVASENKQHLKLTLGRLQSLWSLCWPTVLPDTGERKASPTHNQKPGFELSFAFTAPLICHLRSAISYLVHFQSISLVLIIFITLVLKSST